MVTKIGRAFEIIYREGMILTSFTFCRFSTSILKLEIAIFVICTNEGENFQDWREIASLWLLLCERDSFQVDSMVKIVCRVGDAHNKAIYLHTYSTCHKPNLGYLGYQSKQTRWTMFQKHVYKDTIGQMCGTLHDHDFQFDTYICLLHGKVCTQKTDTQKDMCYDETGLCAQSALSVVNSLF